jgi:hypothetical protein
MPKYLRIKDAAREYGVDVRWLRQACLAGKVAAAKVGKLWYVTAANMEKLFQNKQTNGM